MPITSYNKTVSGDFNGTLDQYQLREDITSSAISETLLEIILAVNDEDVTIKFADALTSGDEDILDDLIANHTPPAPSKHIFYRYNPSDCCLKYAPTYRRIGNGFEYGGSDNIGPINYIEVVSWCETSQFSLRVYDLTNRKVMAEITNVSNTTEGAVDVGTISEIPTQKAILEVQGKVETNDKSILQVSEVIVYHNN